MKISCCWMYAIGTYGFPPKIEDMLKAIKEMAELGFDYIELEGVGYDNLSSVIENPMGQIFESKTHRLLLDRAHLIIQKNSNTELLNHVIETVDSKVLLDSKTFYMKVEESVVIQADKTSAQVDFDKLIFPLTLRRWNLGDTFNPLGMEGSKKLSDYFIQEKLSRFEKESVPILVNGNGDLIWIVGMRLDNRVKLTENTKKVLTLVYK